MGDDRPAVYLEESLVDGEARERWVFRASALGGCTRALIEAGRGTPGRSVPEFMQVRYDEGHQFEAPILWRVQNGIAKPSPRQAVKYPHMHGEQIPAPDGYQHELELPVGPRAVIRCHPDEVTELDVREAKFFGPDFWDRWIKRGILGFPHYMTQVSIEMFVTGRPAVFIVGQKMIEGEGDAREVSLGEVQYEVFDEPLVPLGAIKAKVAKLLSLIESGATVECSERQFPCPYFWLEGALCNTDTGDTAEVVELDGDDAAEVRVAVAQYQAGQEQEKAGQKLKKEWGPKISALVERHAGKGGRVRIPANAPLADPVDSVTPARDDGGYLIITDHVEQREARTVEYKAGEVRYPRLKKAKGSTGVEEPAPKGDE